MTERYHKLGDIMKGRSLDESSKYVLNPEKDAAIDWIFKTLRYFKLVTNKLQNIAILHSEVRVLVDSVCQILLFTFDNLKHNCAILKIPLSESPIIKVKSRAESTLTQTEPRSVKQIFSEGAGDAEVILWTWSIVCLPTRQAT